MLWAAIAVVIRVHSQGILEGGDGILHYQIARFSWDHPELFLDHWGKPLFTLFSSPFAQLGHWGMVVFNGLCMVVTAWAADRLLRHAGRFAQWVYAPALMLVPVYGTMVLAGMTEIFFGMLTMLVVAALFDERYRSALIITSFMPFARPEYIAFAPFVVLWVVLRGRWRALPFLLFGHILFAVIGAFVLHDPLWAFNNDPYKGASSIYGSGDLLHFTDHIQNIFGAPLMWFGAFSILAGGWLWWRTPTTRRTLELLFIVALLPSLAILALHSILWWKGWKGSLGLFRVMATTAPLVVLCAAWCIGALMRTYLVWRYVRGAIGVLAIFAYTYVAVGAFLKERPVPFEETTYEQFLARVGKHVKEIKGGYERVIYYHPQVGYYAEVDPFDPNTTANYWRPDGDQPSLGLRPKDLLVWDAHFGPNEGGTPLELLTGRQDLELVSFMVPYDRMEVLGGHPFEVYMFTPGTNGSITVERTIMDQQHGLFAQLEHRFEFEDEGGKACFGEDEFPFELFGLPCDTIGLLFAEVTFSGELVPRDGTKPVVHGVMTIRSEGRQVNYWSEELRAGAFSITYRVPPGQAGMENKLYLWDQGRVPFCLDQLRITVQKHVRSI